MRLASLAEPFDDPDWIYELKHDGWRCLVYVSEGLVRLVSRYGHYYTCFDTLAREIGCILAGREAVLDGELVCLDDEGKSQFYDLLRNRATLCIAVFDLLWLDGARICGNAHSSNAWLRCANCCRPSLAICSTWIISSIEESLCTTKSAVSISRALWPNTNTLPIAWRADRAAG